VPLETVARLADVHNGWTTSECNVRWIAPCATTVAQLCDAFSSWATTLCGKVAWDRSHGRRDVAQAACEPSSRWSGGLSTFSKCGPDEEREQGATLFGQAQALLVALAGDGAERSYPDEGGGEAVRSGHGRAEGDDKQVRARPVGGSPANSNSAAGTHAIRAAAAGSWSACCAA
jgi:hypothetical protein